MTIRTANTITIDWWHNAQPMATISPQTREQLNDQAWLQVCERLRDGYREGELVFDIYRGYWSIETKEIPWP